LEETRQNADAGSSLLGELLREYPRLEGRAARLRAEYDKLRGLFDDALRTTHREDVATIRERLGALLSKLRHVQAMESELLFEAFHVDIGAGD
jgi:hypothetical protein